MIHIKMVAATAALVALGGAGGWRIANADTAPSAADQQAGAELYQQLVDTMYGSGRDRAGSSKLTYQRIHQAIGACMKARGSQYHPPRYQGGTDDGPVTPGGFSISVSIRSTFGFASTYEREVRAEAPTPADNAGLTSTADYQRGLTRCNSAGRQYQTSEYPASSLKISEKFLQALTRAEKSDAIVPMLASYGQCLRQAGYAAATWAELHDLVQSKFPPPNGPWAKLAAMKEWTDAVAYERDAATADTQCRADLRATGLGVALPEMKEFQHDYAPELEAAAAEWDQLRKDIRAAGITN